MERQSSRPSRFRDRLDRHAAACATVAAVIAAHGSAEAAIVRQTWNQVMGATSNGIYILITGGGGAGSFQTQGSMITGWDINIAGSNRLEFNSNSSFASGNAYVRTEGTGPLSSLAIGSVISSASTFIGSSTPIGSTNVGSNGWTLNAINYFGFRFFNDSTSAVNYGYGAIQVGATATVRTLLYLDYGNAGEAVTITAPIPAPGAVALLGLAGLAGRRRVRR